MRKLLLGALALLPAVILGSAGAAEVPELITKLKDKDADVRRMAAEALGKFGKDAAPAVKPLTQALTTDPKGTKKKPNDESISLYVVTALGEIATADDKDAIAAITRFTDKKQRNKE